MIENARGLLRSGKKRIIIQASCGSGKTIIAASIVSSAIEKGKKVLFIVHYRELAYQALERFTEFGIGNEVGIIMAGEDSCLNLPVQIASIQTYTRRLNLEELQYNPWFHKADLVIYDECHSSLAKTRKAVLDLYKKDTVILGLTATPCRADGRGLGEIYESIVSCTGIKELTDSGYLVPAIYYGCKERPDLENIPMVAGDFNKKVLGERVDLPKLIGDIYDNWARIAIDRQTVIFATNVKHSKHIRDLFQRRGINIEHVDAHTPEEERRDILNRFKSGDVQVVTNCAIYGEGADFPWASCVVLAKPSKSYGRYIQMAGRGLRPYPDKSNCIARDTLILTDKGSVKIQNITLDNAIWDGVSFVRHKGAVRRGVQKTITYSGLTATPDHEVMTNEGWKTFQETAYRRLRIIKTGLGGKAIWFDENNIQKNGREVGQVKGQCGLWEMWKRIYVILSQYAEKAINKGLPVLQPSYAFSCPEMALRESSSTKKQMRKQERYSIYGLWRAWNKIQVRIGLPCDSLDKRESWDSGKQKEPNRQNRQQWSLRTNKFKMDICNTEYEQFTENQRGKKKEIYKIQNEFSRDNVCRQNACKVNLCGDDRRRNNAEMENPIAQTEREVWDILDAGPLQRFTANGLLVHNCIIIDHAGLVIGKYGHGFLDDEVYWTLDGKETAWKKKVECKKEKKIFECEMCMTMHSGKRCPTCGWEIPDWGKKIETTDDELVELGKNKKPKAYTTKEKQQWWQMFEHERRSLDKSDKWLLAQYRSKFKVWPRGMDNLPPIEPTQAVKNWLTYQRVRYFKSKKRLDNNHMTMIKE
jgi:superfamily II DNA or RNA helicase